MANMIIKPAADGNLLIQDRAGGAVLSTDTSGATLGNSTQDNITRLGTVTSGTLASTTTFPAGHIVQVKQVLIRDAFSSSSSSYVATDTTGSITPSDASNKVLVMINSVLDTSAASRTPTLMIYRNGVAVSNAGEGLMQAMDRGGGTRFPFSIHWLDSPNSTSAVTYTLYAKAASTFECPPYGNLDAQMTFFEIRG